MFFKHHRFQEDLPALLAIDNLPPGVLPTVIVTFVSTKPTSKRTGTAMTGSLSFSILSLSLCSCRPGFQESHLRVRRQRYTDRATF